MIARVFPRQTTATPRDAYAFVGEPGLFLPDDIAEVHVSVAFTYDLPRAEELARSWARLGVPVNIGGPATGARGEEFVPGRYIAEGYTITSRGCPNACWFCTVPKREGPLRELPIRDGWNVLDDNLLACSEEHIRAVFAMLARVKQERHVPVEFTGGLEAARLQPWHVDLLSGLKPKQVFFAYDTPDDYEPLVAAGRLLRATGMTFPARTARCFVLMGYPKDTIDRAEQRCLDAVRAGFFPMAMLWRNTAGDVDGRWKSFQRTWARPAATHARLRELGLLCGRGCEAFSGSA